MSLKFSFSKFISGIVSTVSSFFGFSGKKENPVNELVDFLTSSWLEKDDEGAEGTKVAVGLSFENNEDNA